MIELSKERVEQILHEETMKTEELATILRAIYRRYMYLYETYFSDIDALNDEKIAELKKYHDETCSLLKYYYMDIPEDVCDELDKFEKKFTKPLLAKDWHATVYGAYREFLEDSDAENKSDECLKAEFREKIIDYFYDAMGYVFRDGFNTGSRNTKELVGGITGLLFGKD